MEINYQKSVFGKLRIDSYKVVLKSTNYLYRRSQAQIVLCYAVAAATWLLCYIIVISFYCISVTFLCGMFSANLKQLLLLILFLEILTKL